MPEAIAPGDSPSTEAAFENNLGRVIATLKSAMPETCEELEEQLIL